MVPASRTRGEGIGVPIKRLFVSMNLVLEGVNQAPYISRSFGAVDRSCRAGREVGLSVALVESEVIHMKRADKDEAIQRMISLTFSNPTMEEFGHGCFAILKEFGAFKALEGIGCKVEIVDSTTFKQ